jgi:hypothetical protein
MLFSGICLAPEGVQEKKKTCQSFIFETSTGEGCN